jgi:hypothetical protein
MFGQLAIGDQQQLATIFTAQQRTLRDETTVSARVKD